MQRQTRQRDAIKAVMHRSKRPLSPDEILERASKSVETLSLSTVYRTLRKLEDEGEIASVDVPGEPARYERAGLDHHHHFLCTVCGRLYDIEGCPGRIDTLAPKGFKVETHELTLIGTCAECA